MANKHNIKSPVCLYSQKELKTLLEKIGFTVDEIYTSEFGNIKSVSYIYNIIRCVPLRPQWSKY